ncbi:MAG: MATE family efflux transporter [Faecalibacterium sp.]
MRTPQEQFEYLTTAPMKKLLFQLSVPTMMSMLITSIYNITDTFFVGQIGTSASGAVGIVASVMTIIQALGFTFGHGAGSNVSRQLGAQDSAAASRFCSTSFFAAVATGLLLTIGGLCFLEPLMLFLGSTETILPYACEYAFYILCAAPIMMGSIILNNILRYEGKANIAMIGLVGGGILNIALDPIFIFGLNMGVAGAGLATACSQLASLLILYSMFARGKTISKISPRSITRSGKEFANIVVTGLPSFGRQGLASVATILLNIAAAPYGDAAIAAMSIVTRIFLFLFSMTLGVGQGLQPIAGFNYGAKKYGRVREVCLLMITVSTALSAIVMVFFIGFSTPLISLFRDDPDVIAIAVPAFRYQCLASLILPTSTATSFLFQSIGKSKSATLLACCRQGIFYWPLIFLLPNLFGITGIQLTQPLSDLCTFVLSCCFLLPFLRHLKNLADGQTAPQS